MKEKKAKKEGAPAREHKASWQEVYATVEDIQRFLDERVMLRYNVVTHRVECHMVEAGLDIAEGSDGLLRIVGPPSPPSADGPVVWEEVTDRLVNSLWAEMSLQKPVRAQDIQRVMASDYVPEYNPFQFYFSRLPPWHGDGNPIFDLSMSVSVKGGTEEQTLFYVYLRKWLVAMVAGWLDDSVVNQEILVFVGRQGIYKTTWFNSLLPAELQPYFHSNTSFGNMTKDEVLKLSQYGLICCEELDAMKPTEMNRLKWAVTTTVTDERAPYAHYAVRRKHIASYCGTGNNVQFIDDDTGTRRWLPFEVESIRSPREFPFDHAAVFAQAYALYRQGFRYWFNDEESQLLARHNERFEVARLERDAISHLFRVPGPGEPGDFYSSADIMQAIGGPLMQRLTPNRLGRAMTALGFEKCRSHGQRGYRVVAYTGVEVSNNRALLARDARPEGEATVIGLEELVDTNDTLF